MTVSIPVSKIPWRWLRRIAVLLTLPALAILWVPYVLCAGATEMIRTYIGCMITLVRSVPAVWRLP